MPVFIPLDRIQDSPFQTRRHYDAAAIEALADSIERDGQLQHPTARLIDTDNKPMQERSYTAARAAADAGAWMVRSSIMCQLAYGHRRARAWRLVWQRHEARAADQVSGAGVPGLDGVPVGTMPVELAPLSDEQMFARAVGENAHRRDLSAVEEAEAMQAAIEAFGWTHERVQQAWGYKDRSTVTNKLRLLKLPEPIRALNATGRLPERTARAIIPAFDLDEALARHQHSQRLDYVLTVDNVVAAVEADETHEGIAAKVRRYLDALEDEAARVKREREPEMFEAADEAEPTADDTHRLQEGTVFRTNYGYRPYRISSITRGCTCPKYHDQISGDPERRNRPSAPHVHLTCEELDGTGPFWVNGYDEDTLRSVWNDDYLILGADEEAEVDQSAAVAAEVVHPEPEPARNLVEEFVYPEPAEKEAEAWPEPALPEAYATLGRLTKGELMRVEDDHSCAHTRPDGYGVGSSSRKAEILAHVQERLQNTANLAAAFDLTDEQADEVWAYLDERRGTGAFHWQFERLVGNQAEHAFGAIRRTLEVVAFSEAGAIRYRRDAVRRLLSTCYPAVIKAIAKGAVEPDVDAFEEQYAEESFAASEADGLDELPAPDEDGGSAVPTVTDWARGMLQNGQMKPEGILVHLARRKQNLQTALQSARDRGAKEEADRYRETLADVGRASQLVQKHAEEVSAETSAEDPHAALDQHRAEVERRLDRAGKVPV